MNDKIYEYDAIIQPADSGGAYVAFPYDIRAEFGKGRVKVHATFDLQELAYHHHAHAYPRVQALREGVLCG